MKKSVKQTEARTLETAAAAAELDPKQQKALFASAMKSFLAGAYAKAKEQFDQASSGPLIQVNESAQMYGRMCQQRLSKNRFELKSAEDHYNYGVSLLNARRLGEAKASLETAVAKDPQPHYLYALALAEGLMGAIESSAAQLRQAIAKDRSIRALARNDADFQPLMQHHQLKELVAGEQMPAA
ncbi:MAG: hypothetical protein HZB13_04375 [Acidobacteria bacterium]|nr:hypothetical protein [Acidobacteriota bacterium]